MSKMTWAGGSSVVLAAAAFGLHAAPSLTIRTPVRRHLPNLSGKGAAGTVALTFDDGPDPRFTPGILEVLERLRWPATFFMLAERAETHPELVHEVIGAGHEVALHGYAHDPLLRMSPGRTLRDLAEAHAVLTGIAGRSLRWFRPTYGALTGSAVFACRRLGLRPVLWTSAANDWLADSTSESMRRAVLDSLDNAGTVLFHDAVQPQVAQREGEAVVAALELLSQDFQALRLRVVALEDHLR